MSDSDVTALTVAPRATNETAVSAVEAHARASVQARWLIAHNKPRDIEKTRQNLLAACRRKEFAAGAMYTIPRGKERVSGLNIRFVEEALRCLTNVHVEQLVISETDEERIVMVRVTDLETNLTFEQPVVIPKTVERRFVPKQKGAEVLRKRTNADGETLYVIRPSDDELLQRQNNYVSRALRSQGIRHLPGWLKDEAEALIEETMRGAVAADPEGERRKVIDAFAKLNVRLDGLREFVGHEMAELSVDELVELRGLFTAILEGDVTFREALEQRRAERGDPKKGDPSKSDAMRDRLQKEREGRKAAKPDAAPAKDTREKLDPDKMPENLEQPKFGDEKVTDKGPVVWDGKRWRDLWETEDDTPPEKAGFGDWWRHGEKLRLLDDDGMWRPVEIPQ